MEHYQHSSSRNMRERESQRLKAKYHEIKQRESETSGEYISQNTINRNPLESSPHKTTQKEVSPIKKRKDSDRVKKSRRSQQHTGSDVQDVIIEMETDNFSDNDNLRSERMIIRDRYERPIIEEEDFLSNAGLRTYDHLPQESSREVIEAAAIFIQKNYRGHRTRKLIKMYFDQICREGLDFSDEEPERQLEDEDDYQDDRYHATAAAGQNKKQQELIKVQDERYSGSGGKEYGEEVESPGDEESEESYEDEEVDQRKDQFLDASEKKSIYDLLERYFYWILKRLKR